ncbi:Polycomb group protein Psc [Melipona quadrifasciata]|uniref:Polycomb group protein Psc n=1 Tax=Melipona quadrifasciata TaxID=166423 RepID=A0A0M9ABL4_9HYME|nr:Polycomb group protein Psc [Melipona quadrifasciata]
MFYEKSCNVKVRDVAAINKNADKYNGDNRNSPAKRIIVLVSVVEGCIVRRLSSGARACPVCNVATSPPLLPDVKLQRLVYLVVPGLFRSELERRRHFRLVNPQCPPLALPLGALDLTLDDFVSLSLCELDEPEEEAVAHEPENRAGSRHRSANNNADQTKHEDAIKVRSTRYLKCPAGVTVRHLVRLLMLKRGWEEANSHGSSINKIEMLCEKCNENRRGAARTMILDQAWTLLDLACIFGWKREAPMKLFYRVLRKEDAVASASSVSSFSDEAAKDTATMENIQRPPTPPPSPKPAPPQECEVEARKILESNVEAPPQSLKTNLEGDKEPKAKKPRCKVTPVMRTPNLVPIQTNHAAESSKAKELTPQKLEHHKHRKRRNKRVIAEITTTPREDLLKLKVRLTPCPPRITSSSANGQAKEKLLQMRAVRREKIKATTTISQQRSTDALVREEGANATKENLGETEETIEEIIDSIPDEVVRIAQNIAAPAEDAPAATDKTNQRNVPQNCTPSPKKEETEPDAAERAEQPEPERPKKDEEILRRLGLVAVNEASDNFRDKTKQRAQNNGEKIDNLDREKLEKQLRESKANRVRSLLAEKQMRDALKTMSKTKEEHPAPVQVSTPPKKKGPPPLTPLRVAKPSGFAASSAILEPKNSKYEIPLDLSSGGTVRNNVLDLSASLPTNFSSILKAKTKGLEQRRGQDSNLMTLSDAAVSLLSGCIADENSVDPLVLSSTSLANKVALRIPQPHQRISSFGMKIKPNLSIRHIPNPQAVVASQYRNQRNLRELCNFIEMPKNVCNEPKWRSLETVVGPRDYRGAVALKESDLLGKMLILDLLKSHSLNESFPQNRRNSDYRGLIIHLRPLSSRYHRRQLGGAIGKMSGIGKRTYLREVNPYLICPLCRGYLIDAITVVECLHSFCRSCILKHLNTEAHCPSCKHVLNKAKPNIKADKALQDIVYKLVPGLYHKEMRRRREFYKKHPEHESLRISRHQNNVERTTFVQIHVFIIKNNQKEETLVETLFSRNAPMRFFYRVALEEQRLEAPPHDRPSTPGLGASLPPVDATVATRENTNSQNSENKESRPQAKITNDDEKPALDNQNKVSNEKPHPPSDQPPSSEPKKAIAKKEQPSSTVTTSTTATLTTISIQSTNVASTATVTNTVASPTSNNEIKQIKTPIKILKNPDGRYEVLRSPPGTWNSKEQSTRTIETKPSNPEFSVVSIGNGQNSNGVKITLKQCTPNNSSPNKPKVISNVLLHCGQVEKESSDALLQQLHRDKEKRQAEKQEKHKRRVTFVEQSIPEKTVASNTLKSIQKKPGEQQEKKQFLQGFQLTARESAPEIVLESSSKFNETNASKETNDAQNKGNATSEKEDIAATETPNTTSDSKKKNNSENVGVNASGNAASASKRVASVDGIGNARVNANKQCSDVDMCTIGYSKNTNVGMNINVNNSSAKVDVYTFSNDPPPVVPVGAVKRKCPPGLPIFDVRKRKHQHASTQISKKQALVHPPPVVQVTNHTKSPRKLPTEHVIPGKRPMNMVGEPGPSRTPTTPNPKPSPAPVLSNDTRNILDGCGLNIPASLSITLTAPKSPGSSGGYIEVNDSKDSRKNTLGKVNPSITLNDRIPQPVTKLKAKPTIRDMPNISDQGQVVTLVGGHRYYRAPPGSLTPAAQRVNDCPLPTPSRTPVYAPGFSSSLGNSRYSTNLSSVFPSLQSLYALSQAPNLQQFQTDARLRIPRGTDANTIVSNTDNRNMNASISGKSHLAAQCAPVKPARSSIAPLAIAITKQQSNDKSASTNARSAANEINKTPVYRNNESLDSTESGQQLSVQTKYSPVAEANNRYSPRATNNTNNGNTVANNEEKTSTEVTTRDSNLETNNDTRKEPDDSSRQTSHREAASPRVSSTASPSPPPGDTNTNTINETVSGHNSSTNTASNGIDNDVPASSPTKKNNIGAEVSSSKSPASPDSSSVTIENPSGKSCSTTEQGCPSPSQISDAVKSLENSTKSETNVAEDSTNENEKKVCIKQADAKQLTSEMFQKRLLAAFPSNEWANNPIAAEHLGNFLKNMNASIKSENKMDSVGSEKAENQLACNDATRLNNDVSSKSRTDVTESS